MRTLVPARARAPAPSPDAAPRSCPRRLLQPGPLVIGSGRVVRVLVDREPTATGDAGAVDRRPGVADLADRHDEVPDREVGAVDAVERVGEVEAGDLLGHPREAQRLLEAPAQLLAPAAAADLVVDDEGVLGLVDRDRPPVADPEEEAPVADAADRGVDLSEVG